MTPTLVFLNASVLTMDPEAPRATAVAVSDDRIVAVGSDAEIDALAGPDTRRIDAGGRTLLPGFVESHVHLFMGGYNETVIRADRVSGLEDLRAAVTAYAAGHPEQSLLVGQGADYAILGQDRLLDRHVLDEICPDRPLMIMAYDFHTAWANTPALEAAGLLDGRELPRGNAVVMGADGKATGELHEKLAMLPVLEVRNVGGRESLGMSGIEPPVPPTQKERAEDRETLKVGLRHAARHGITTMHNMDGNRYMLEILREIEDEGALISRLRVPFHLTAEMDLSELDRASAMTRDFTGDTLCSGFVKIFLDGVIASGTAAMLEPYANRPDHRGDLLFTREDFIAAAVEIDKRGMQIAIHAIGDAAVRLALDGYEAAARANGPRDRRHRIEHVEMLHPDDLERFAELGVIASMQPPHAPVREDETTVGIGAERAGMAYAWRRIADTGAVVSFSSDWPIVPISPLAGIQAAMTRQNWVAGGPDQRLSLHEVLAAYTCNGAYVGFAEGLTGTIRTGMKADLALLSGDIETTQADRIGALEVDLTLFDGKVTHER
ncbi:amidohydrolase [Pseudosulfitobacter pseudonitzschiae]|uniref:amidohydrolase n=1 Tax=Pseudosulfitobacter pseudonitzschiae TaxID=1402135 RepID=UPI001AF5AB62|nr:amidohydrolase [Pseudosulfitobacter pseudonitzschiae]MBM1816713.1 amidohydrolase [Pseudosulfitobacter pseudonitzschiae]MBM1833523.1 amidohydrolase [Pseudosulfitobacter pseudonitzschiae]MBM1838390.1 amidohydrolase [Pseudosulfitobacter pseudonitzschiae]MBM1843440.1 amidohydrolase [Pseudosulfitobacter pseudonitzschiae]MBM1848306.1 amidohydrolase [Pseudosulfitobacter pseudonitzschiae]